VLWCILWISWTDRVSCGLGFHAGLAEDGLVRDLGIYDACTFIEIEVAKAIVSKMQFRDVSRGIRASKIYLSILRGDMSGRNAPGVREIDKLV